MTIKEALENATIAQSSAESTLNEINEAIENAK